MSARVGGGGVRYGTRTHGSTAWGR